MSPFDNREFNGHELVVFGHDEPTGLQRHHRHPLHRARPGRRRLPHVALRDHG